MHDVPLPDLPGGRATLLRWLAAPGDDLAAGASLAVVLTERVEVVLPTPAAGRLAELAAAPGATLEPGVTLARLEPVSRQSPSAPRAPRATPLARTMARAHGLDLAALISSGPGGRIVRADILAAIGQKADVGMQPAASNPPQVNARSPEANGGTQPAAANAAIRSFVPHSSIPIATATIEVDLGAALNRMADLAPGYTRLGLAPSLSAYVAHAAAGLLPDHPLLNATWGDELMLLRRRLHLAVACPEGERFRWSLVPDAGDLTMRGIVRAISGPPGDPAGATFAIVSLDKGASWLAAHPPLPGTAAALSIGTPVRRPVVVDDGVAVRPLGMLSLSYDARILDHAQAAAFLRAIQAALT